jgi:ABC-type branched-subunit amino acid transport system permease subunit
MVGSGPGSRRLGALAAGLVLAGGLLSHALDEEGLLPGVHEAERVRGYADRGAPFVLLVLGCVAVSALVGLVVARRAARRTGIPAAHLLALVVAGQATLFASFEVVARLAAGLDVAEAFVEPAFVTGVAVQVLVAAAFVALLFLAGRRLRSSRVTYGIVVVPNRPARVAHVARRAGLRRPETPMRGRAPPLRFAANFPHI